MSPRDVLLASAKRLLLLWAFSTVSLFAQVDTGALSGVVMDATGAVVPNAKVVITQIETGFQTPLITNSAGFYSAPALRPGTYSVSVAAAGFRTETL